MVAGGPHSHIWPKVRWGQVKKVNFLKPKFSFKSVHVLSSRTWNSVKPKVSAGSYHAGIISLLRDSPHQDHQEDTCWDAFQTYRLPSGSLCPWWHYFCFKPTSCYRYIVSAFFRPAVLVSSFSHLCCILLSIWFFFLQCLPYFLRCSILSSNPKVRWT